jgi:large conductance mechanosensitive channel
VLKEFREFIQRGNVIDLAVAVVIGAAFTSIVTSFNEDLLSPIISIVGGEPDLSAYSVTVNGADIRFGAFLTAVINFLIVGFAVFLVVKAINAAQSRIKRPEEEAAEEAASAADEQVALLTEIRDSLRNR